MVGFLLLWSPRSVIGLQVEKESRTNRQARILIITGQLGNRYQIPGYDLTADKQTLLATELLALIEVGEREAGEAKKLEEDVDAWKT